MRTPADFRALCHRHRLAATHQRQVIYTTAMSLSGHPSPEDIYERTRKSIPSISLATVYKNLRTFLDRGLLREVSLHHGSLRVESNFHPHHHLVCMRCKSITDLEHADLKPSRLRAKLPRGFQVKRIAVDILGICAKCASHQKRRKQQMKFDFHS
jgi:Fur family transcriptional regulator, peroxide stress response regulator